MDAAGRVHQINSAGVVEQESPSDVVDGPSIPTAFLLCIAIGLYVTLMLVALVVRKYANNKKELCCCEKVGCSCSAFSSVMDCCSWLNGRLRDAALLQCNCAKQISCCESIRCPDTFCGMTAGRCSSCLAPSSLFDCGRCDCTCSCRLPECQSINCCCFEIHIKK